MSRRRTLFPDLALAGSLLVLLLTGCATPRAARVPNLWQVEQGLSRYVDSGAYDRDFAAVADRARAWLEQRARHGGKLAIVLDIDETSLSNWPAYRVNNWARVTAGPCDLEHGPCGLRAWQAMAKSPALAPTLALVRRAHELGVAVFFVTGRPEALRAPTEENLRAAGYTWDGLVLPPAGAVYASAAQFKAPARQAIAAQGYAVVLSMGDQQSDLDGGFAERTFKLPNPVYFLP
jgi:acid phosphatase